MLTAAYFARSYFGIWVFGGLEEAVAAVRLIAWRIWLPNGVTVVRHVIGVAAMTLAAPAAQGAGRAAGAAVTAKTPTVATALASAPTVAAGLHAELTSVNESAVDVKVKP